MQLPFKIINIYNIKGSFYAEDAAPTSTYNTCKSFEIIIILF